MTLCSQFIDPFCVCHSGRNWPRWDCGGRDDWPYHVGCVGLRSVPMISLLGWSSPKLDRPDARSAADIEDSARVVTDGGEVAFAAKADAEHLVNHVKAVSFALEGQG